MIGQRKKIDIDEVEKRFDKRLSVRAKKKKIKMKVSGAGVRKIQEIIKKNKYQ